jgi:hypothetical protein
MDSGEQLSGSEASFSGLARLERGSIIGGAKEPELPRHRHDQHTTAAYVANAVAGHGAPQTISKTRVCWVWSPLTVSAAVFIAGSQRGRKAGSERNPCRPERQCYGEAALVGKSE